MSYFVGIDLGTSGVRTLIAQPDGKILSVSSERYSISTIAKNLAEQSPEEWWKATARTIKCAIKKALIKPSMIEAISFSGQMHGMVIIDKDLIVIRPAIIFRDFLPSTAHGSVAQSNRCGSRQKISLLKDV